MKGFKEAANQDSKKAAKSMHINIGKAYEFNLFPLTKSEKKGKINKIRPISPVSNHIVRNEL